MAIDVLELQRRERSGRGRQTRKVMPAQTTTYLYLHTYRYEHRKVVRPENFELTFVSDRNLKGASDEIGTHTCTYSFLR